MKLTDNPGEPRLEKLIAELHLDTQSGRATWEKAPSGDGYRIRQQGFTVQLLDFRFFRDPSDYDGYPGYRASLHAPDGTQLEVLDGSLGDDPADLKALFALAGGQR